MNEHRANALTRRLAVDHQVVQGPDYAAAVRCELCRETAGCQHEGDRAVLCLFVRVSVGLEPVKTVLQGL